MFFPLFSCHGWTYPVVRIGCHHIEVAAHEGHNLARLCSWICDDEVASSLCVAHVLNLQGATLVRTASGRRMLKEEPEGADKENVGICDRVRSLARKSLFCPACATQFRTIYEFSESEALRAMMLQVETQSLALSAAELSAALQRPTCAFEGRPGHGAPHGPPWE